jgi:hypothetical protein
VGLILRSSSGPQELWEPLLTRFTALTTRFRSSHSGTVPWSRSAPSSGPFSGRGCCDGKATGTDHVKAGWTSRDPAGERQPSVIGNMLPKLLPAKMSSGESDL